ncbi:DEAD/DEAH box helicase [Spiractinospora alimapuensis]|uniref:DEAD/DEAH box helicase n=1 Tax=Spiractinospora alimapuensis TaxID=2820884 RepID=UPI001F2AE885|nr:DEAD/DEAH box helicase [Spiractinospora alimapuensis]QVQ52441.1 DEAD/DEAH box helicase [Spiractinospora alimapuensis]
MTQSSRTGFGALGLPDRLVDRLADNGVTEPFPIQASTIPDVLAGRDVLGRGRTGSGKTLAFGLPLLARLSADGARRPRPGRPRALILVPTRELAHQVRDALIPYARVVGLWVADVVGGAPYVRQINELRRGVDVLVATPGRLSDLISQRACSLTDVTTSVLDEADQMCDMGFLPQVSELIGQIPSGRQTLLFSATLDGDVDTLVARYLSDPVEHAVDPAVSRVATMEHHMLKVLPRDKNTLIDQIASREGRTLLFARSRHRADAIAEGLARAGVPSAALHAGKSQSVRARTLAKFRDGTLHALVATDVAARGIHIDGIDLVVNVDLPNGHKDYLHRGGRTARAGESGRVVTLVQPNQRRRARRLMDDAGVDARWHLVNPGDALLTTVTGARAPSYVPWVEPPEPERPSRGRGGPRSQRHGAPRRGGRRYGQNEDRRGNRGPRHGGRRGTGQTA